MHTNILVPRKLETASVRRGRSLCVQMIDRVGELHDKGKKPVKVIISTAWHDDLRAFFEFNNDIGVNWDGVLPSGLAGLPIEYVPGADRRVQIVCEER